METADKHQRSCLIIEDNIVAAELMKVFFSRNNIASNIADDGKKGLQMFLAAPHDYDAIFLDIQMPDLDGYQVARLIRESEAENAKSIPIIAMSGTNTGDVEKSGCFNFFLRKPFGLHFLLNVLDDVLQK